MGHAVHIIKDKGFFLPSYSERIKGVLSYIFGRHAHTQNTSFENERNVECAVIKDGDISYKCYHYEAPNANHILVIPGGLRSTGQGRHEIFDVARRAGMSVIFGELPVDKDKDADLEKIEKMSRSFLLKTPFLDRYKNTPKYLIGHSTGASCIAFALHDKDCAKKILDKFDCIKGFGACFAPSYKESAWQRIVYPPHANRHSHEEYGESLGDKLHIVWNILRGNPYSPAPIDNPYPKHSEIIAFGNALENRTSKLLATPFPECVKNSNKIEFIHGERDNVSGPKAAKEVALHMNAKFTPMENTFHNPYTPERIAAILFHIFNPYHGIRRRRRLARPTEAFTLMRLPLAMRMRSRREIPPTHTPEVSPPAPTVLNA